MGKRVGYEAQAASYGPDAWYALVVPVSTGGGEALATRHARAMKAVLLAAKAWAKAATALEVAYERDVHVSAGAPIAQRHLDATKRLLDAQARLAKIEKEVSRG